MKINKINNDIIVINDVFHDSFFKQCQNISNQQLLKNIEIPLKWYDMTEIHLYSDICLMLLQIANGFFSCKYLGYESWTRINNSTNNWHIDKDEYKANVEKKLSLPEFSIIYYFNVTGINGGEFLISKDKISNLLSVKELNAFDKKTDILSILPESNMAIFFSKGLVHKANFTKSGKRHNLIINPFYEYNTL